MAIYFLRHGQSQANVEGVLAGQLDSPLTELGIHQAQHEGERLKGENMYFDIIITSPLVRAYDTAVIIAEAVGYPLGELVTDSRLMERHVGELEGEPASLLAEAIHTEGMGVESNSQLSTRCQAVLSDIDARYPNKIVLLVAHAGVGEVMKALVQSLDLSSHQPEWSIPNAQIFQLS